MTERPLKICVVEDVRASREMMRMLLELDGHQVLTAETGEGAVRLLTQESPDLAFVDIGLPDISGYEVVRRIRAAENGHSIRLVALTGYGQPSDIEQAQQAGFDYHIAKPITNHQLQSVYDWMKNGASRSIHSSPSKERLG